MPLLYLAVLLAYSALLVLLSHMMHADETDETFFRAGRRSPWWVVAIGMVGASVSGVSVVSVPGMVIAQDMTYMQMVAGFFFGYLIISFVLLPLYYRLNLTSIYEYLGLRIGKRAYHTATAFFVLSKLTGAAARLFLTCTVLQWMVFDPLRIPFIVNVIGVLAMTWVYTRRYGIYTIVYTDMFQTLFMLLTIILMVWFALQANDCAPRNFIEIIAQSSHSRMIEWSWLSPGNWLKQFLSGVFVAVVMTGLDQDMMQKNLTCHTLRESQKNVCWYGAAFIPVNLLLLMLGVLLIMLAESRGAVLPAKGDELILSLVGSGGLGYAVSVCFFIAVLSAAFSSVDSAITSLTTVITLNCNDNGHHTIARRHVHVAVTVAMVLCVMIYHWAGGGSVLTTIYTLCGYTYGPLLGMFAYGILCKNVSGNLNESKTDRYVPYICLASPVAIFVLDYVSANCWDYRFGYELLMINGLLVFAMLCTAHRGCKPN